MVNRIVVGAHYGLKDWLAQRITAIVMAVYSIVLAASLLFCSEVTLDGWRTLLSGTCMQVFTFLFILSLAYHAWVGVRDIWMDYIKCTALRLTLHVVTLLALLGYAGWAIQILWRL